MDAPKRPLLRTLLYLIAGLYAVITLGPFLISVATSLTRTQDVDKLVEHGMIPPVPTLGNYTYLIQNGHFGLWTVNSLLVGVLTVAGEILFNSLAGYALARIRFPGRQFLFWCVLATMMVPGVVLLVPQYIMLTRLGWVNSFQGIIVPYLSTAFGIFLMRQFFITLPVELEEAARIDGLGRWGIFWRVMLPLSRSALVAQTIFAFLGSWNNFMWPFLVARSVDVFTLPVGLQSFKVQHYQFWNQVMAGSMFLSIPVIIIFLILQRWFTRGISLTGLKG